VATAAAIAHVDVTAQAAGAAGQDVSHGPRLIPTQVQRGHVVAQNVGDAGSCALGAGHATAWTKAACPGGL
jgi:hypothetical protein